MYYQLFIRNSEFKEVQFSCDTWEEVIELIEKRDPQVCRVDYYNSFGWLGTAWKRKNFFSGFYDTYRKRKNREQI